MEPVLDDFGEDESSAAAAAVSDSETEEQEEQPVESVLSEIAKDEIDEVGVHCSQDIVMRGCVKSLLFRTNSLNLTAQSPRLREPQCHLNARLMFLCSCPPRWT